MNCDSFEVGDMIEMILDMRGSQPLLKYIINGKDFGFIPKEKVCDLVIDPEQEYRLAILLSRETVQLLQ